MFYNKKNRIDKKISILFFFIMKYLEIYFFLNEKDYWKKEILWSSRK